MYTIHNTADYAYCQVQIERYRNLESIEPDNIPIQVYVDGRLW